MSTEIVTQEIKGGIEAMQEWSAALVVSDAAQYAFAGERLREVAKMKASIVTAFSDPKKKSHEAWKAIVAMEKSFTDRLDRIRSGAEFAMLAWKREEDEKARKEQERLTREAEARAEKEREKLLARAAKAEEKGKDEKAEDLAAQAAAVQPIVPIVQAPAPAVKGVATQKRWKVKSVNKARLVLAASRDPNLLGYLDVNEAALEKTAQALKGAISISGVVFEQVESMRIGTK